ncbi:MAG: fimbria/pilus periplasmic chaperone [Myxococcota bacterium]
MRIKSKATFIGIFLGYASLATAFSVTPLELQVIAPKKMDNLQIGNSSKAGVTIQGSVAKWERINGQDILVPTKDVIIAPPMILVPPDRVQIIRVVRVKSTPVEGEEAYRIMLDGLPPPPLMLQKSAAGAMFVTTMSIPVFFSARDVQPAVEWKAIRQGDRLIVKGTNTGKKHFFAREIIAEQASPKGGAPVKIPLVSNGAARILPGASELWISEPLKGGFALGQPVILNINTPKEPVTVSAAITAPEMNFLWLAKKSAGKLEVELGIEGGKAVTVKSILARDSTGQVVPLEKDTTTTSFVSINEKWVSAKLEKGFADNSQVTLTADTNLGPMTGTTIVRADLIKAAPEVAAPAAVPNPEVKADVPVKPAK